MKRTISFITLFPIIVLALISCNEINTSIMSTEMTVRRQDKPLSQDINVSLNEANGIADRFVSSNYGDEMPQTKSLDSSKKTASSVAVIREDEQDLMYVFNYYEGGFVIVGSTRNYYPILAYSDKGAFELHNDMGPIDIWLDETKTCIKNSSSLSEETKTEMQKLWAQYDGSCPHPLPAEIATRRPQTRSTGEDACWERIEELQALYGNKGWTFNSLSNAEYYFTEWGFEDLYDDICYNAWQNHSDPSETVIGYKYPVYSHVGPLLSTNWHQNAPFGKLCPNHIAGCGAIAAAQVMKYYEYPPSMSWGGVNFTWSNIPDNPDSTSKQPHLIRMLGQKIQMDYSSPLGSHTNPDKLVNGLDSLGFIISRQNYHNYSSVRDSLLDSGIPVIMSGKSNGTGHFWVCDGVTESITNQIIFYTENQPYGAGSFSQGLYSYNNPGIIGGTNFYMVFHLNWCLNQDELSYNGWYTANTVESTNGCFPDNRTNIFIKEP